MKNLDFTQKDENKRPAYLNGGIDLDGKNVKSIEIIFKDAKIHLDAGKNTIVDKKGNVVKWCDVRKGLLYMFWQKLKFKIFNKI